MVHPTGGPCLAPHAALRLRAEGVGAVNRRDLPRYLVDQCNPDERIKDLEAQVEALRAARQACPFCASKTPREKEAR